MRQDVFSLHDSEGSLINTTQWIPFPRNGFCRHSLVFALELRLLGSSASVRFHPLQLSVYICLTCHIHTCTMSRPGTLENHDLPILHGEPCANVPRSSYVYLGDSANVRRSSYVDLCKPVCPWRIYV